MIIVRLSNQQSYRAMCIAEWWKNHSFSALCSVVVQVQFNDSGSWFISHQW
jgi:hypothetical protein